MNDENKIIRYSVVIPVYNSANVIGETIKRTVSILQKNELDYELILVNDGSKDNSWKVICEKAAANPAIVGINFIRNYGQHTATLCGFHHASGEFVITLDDDLQNPPEEIIHLINKAEEGHDLVFGRFHKKRHALYRRVGSALIGMLNNRLFYKPKDLVTGGFRILRRDLVDRICAYRTPYPYITGLALLFAANPANVWVDHHKRKEGKSQYDLLKIIELVMRILFNYSSYPLRLISVVGMVIALFSFILGLYFIGEHLVGGVPVPGWTSLVVLLSFLNGIIILILSMLGEYCVRLLNQTSYPESYQIKDVVGSAGDKMT
jgi:glycosyltransferase involved in cell wall biosynthesis